MIEVKIISAFDRNDFRKWLMKNHRKETKVAVILYKRHTGKFAPTHREMIEEAICFGWIDTTIKRLDEDRFMRHFSKRNINSRWSDNTLRYGKELIKEEKMTEEGLKFYKLGRSKPTLDHGIPKNPSQPPELEKELNKNKKVAIIFNAFPPSKKKLLYRWVLRGKLVETRQKRIRKIIETIKSGESKIM